MKRSRTTGTENVPVPPVLPVVRMTVQPDDTMQVTLDGAPYPPPDYAPAWRRDAFAWIIDAITKQLGVGIRVEVIEADGRTFTDIITPSRQATQPPQQTSGQPETELSEGQSAAVQPQYVQLTGSGFIAGEAVAVAIIVAYADATPDGICRATFDTRQFAGTPTNEAVLIGSISGTFAVGRPT